MKQLLFIIAAFLLLTGCKKEINLDLDDKSGVIVIEGNITDQPGPYYVRITKSVAFTEANQYPPITDALVIISDNAGHTDTLKYDADGRYKTTSLSSAPGNTYTLNVIAAGVSYAAQSTMPPPVVLDSLSQGSLSFGKRVRYTVIPVFTDPSALGNRYLFISSVNGLSYKTLETISDNIDNGMVNKRSLTPSTGNEDDDVDIGDTIHVEMQCIDQDVYTYYTALTQLSRGGGPGGGVTPSDPPSNISNGALGVFSAHTVRRKAILIK